ncbi:MAG: hypothetical protein K0Q79_1760 [Flavipsychrobacter sp.]|jgi:hypothetical protein|nr:hypothetical protein [Flavipsychrobacter sp.]
MILIILSRVFAKYFWLKYHTMEQHGSTRTTIYNDRRRVKTGASGGIYFLAFIGSLVYYLQHAATFGAGVIGFLKAIVWPAFVVYEIMKYLNM